MRGIILIESLVLVCITLNYILKCLECKDLRDLFDNRGKSIKMLNNQLNKACLNMNIQFKEILHLKHKVYVLRKDIKRKDRAIVRYKEQNAKFKPTCDEQSRRLEDLRDRYLTESNVARWYIKAYGLTRNERDAYLYCLRQIQEEVTNAKEE